MNVRNFIALTAVAVSITVSQVAAELRIAYVESDRILSEYKATKSVEDQIKKQQALWEQDATDRQKKMADIKEQLDKQSLLLSAEKKKDLESQFQQMYVDYQKFLQEKMGPQGEAAKMQEKLVKPLIEKINILIEKIAKAQNYDFIFDSKAGLVYAKKAYDLTDEVIRQLNNTDTAPVSAPAGAPAK